MKMRNERIFPIVLEMRDETWRHQQVGPWLSRGLIRDENFAALGVARFDNHGIQLSAPLGTVLQARRLCLVVGKDRTAAVKGERVTL
jgi:hypothetical protein